MKTTDITKIRQLLKKVESAMSGPCGGWMKECIVQALALLPCEKCEELLQEKCRWEQMSRAAVKQEWPNFACPDCQPKSCVCCEEITEENVHLHRNCVK